MSTYNVVLFGGTGAGKSSVVNLIVGESVAKVSSDVTECTTAFQDYFFVQDSVHYRLWDTPGLKEPHSTLDDQAPAVVEAYNLTQRLNSQGGVNLLVYCISGIKDINTSSGSPSMLQSHYRLFHELFCPNVPLAIVVTQLDSRKRREEWWKRNEGALKGSELSFVGSACITAHTGSDPSGFEESARSVRSLLSHCSRKSQWNPRTVREKLRLTKEAAKSIASTTFVGWNINMSARMMVGMLMTRYGLDGDEARELSERMRGTRDLSRYSSRNGDQSVMEFM